MIFKSGPVIVVGAGGHARVVLSMLKQLGEQAAYILDDDPELHGRHVADLPVKGGTPMLGKGDRAVIAIGNNRHRQKVAAAHTETEYRTYIHPSAVIDDNVEIGDGTVVMAGAVIQSGSRLGSHVIVNSGVVIDHDNRVEDFCHLGPNATLAGGSVLEEGVFLGAGAIVIEEKRVGPWTVVGAGACVIRDLDGNRTAVGVPARPIGVHREEDL